MGWFPLWFLGLFNSEKAMALRMQLCKRRTIGGSQIPLSDREVAPTRVRLVLGPCPFLVYPVFRGTVLHFLCLKGGMCLYWHCLCPGCTCECSLSLLKNQKFRLESDLLHIVKDASWCQWISRMPTCISQFLYVVVSANCSRGLPLSIYGITVYCWPLGCLLGFGSSSGVVEVPG